MNQTIEGYRNLSQEEINMINEIKCKYDNLLDMLKGIADKEGSDIRCMSIAVTELQTSSMWAIRAITKLVI